MKLLFSLLLQFTHAKQRWLGATPACVLNTKRRRHKISWATTAMLVGVYAAQTHHLPLHTYKLIRLCDYPLAVVYVVGQLRPPYSASVVSHITPNHNEGVLDLASEVMCEKRSCQSLLFFVIFLAAVVLIYLSFPEVTEFKKKNFHTDTCETHHFFFLLCIFLLYKIALNSHSNVYYII